MDISIHTPAKGVTLDCAKDSEVGRYFNPHSREGSDEMGAFIMSRKGISIHTPAKGVTAVSVPFFYLFSISIHTPAKGVTAILPNFRLYIL